MRLSDEEELEVAAVESRVHLQLNRSGRRPRTADRPERPAHLECGARGALSVTLSVVEQQQCVAAELEQATALRVGNAEKRGERRIHHLRDFLRSLSSQAREALRHRGEAGDVDEGDGSLDLSPGRCGLVSEPLERQTRNERDEIGRRRGERVRRGLRHDVILAPGIGFTERLPLLNSIPPERGRPIRRIGRIGE